MSRICEIVLKMSKVLLNLLNRRTSNRLRMKDYDRSRPNSPIFQKRVTQTHGANELAKEKQMKPHL
jgi:hypothetical protein